MHALISGFVHDKSAARVIEYGFIVASIVVATIVVVQVLGWIFS